MNFPTVKLGNVAKFINGGAWTQSEYTNKGIPVVRVSDILNGRINLSKCKYLSSDSLEKYRKHVLYKDDLIVATVGSHKTQQSSVVGKHAIVSINEEGALLNQNAVKIIPIDENILDKRFLRFLGSSAFFKAYIAEHARGSANQARIAISELKNMDIALPSIDIQRKIGRILASLEEKIDLNDQINQTLENMAMTLYKHLFIETANVEKTKSLKDFIILNPKISVKKGTVLKYVDMKALPTNQMSVMDEDLIEKDYKSGTKFMKSDVLLARITPCLENGKATFVDFLNEEEIAFGSTEFLVFRANEQSCPQFLYCLVKDPKFHEFAKQSMVGTSGRQRIQNSVLLEYEMPDIHEEKMKKFKNATEKWFSQVRQNTIENHTLKQTRDYLLPRLLSGEIEIRETEKIIKEVL
ncbi:MULTISPECIES: restriction endonuclease subunit S [Priestia]|uniref:Restriction endonuclease subunit S n=1 Tax=Priestia aryabhattai TaxID=412384 RepID=A0ABD5L4Y7_PRIAR|nr:restriction endonuclease subunit S [Priestia megaterium]MCU7741433.1 restriction endonuclease subunit S [Priestia megaterium]